MATMAKNKSSSSSSVCHHSPPALPPTMVEDFGSLSLGCFSFSRPSWPHTLSRLSLSLLSQWSSKAPMAWTRARTPSRTHSHTHRGFRSGQGSLTRARQPPWPWTRALKLSPSHSYGSKPHGFDDGTTVMRLMMAPLWWRVGNRFARVGNPIDQMGVVCFWNLWRKKRIGPFKPLALLPYFNLMSDNS